MALEDIVARLILNVIILLIGALLLRWIAGSIVKNKASKSLGNAFIIMVVWVILDIVLTWAFGYSLLFLLVEWFIFAFLCIGIYKSSFWQGLLIGLLLIIVIIILIIVLTVVLVLIGIGIFAGLSLWP